MFGKLRGSVGAAFISNDPGGDYDTDVSGVGVEVGVRFQASAFLLETAFVSRSTTYDVTDPADPGVVPATLPETEFAFTGIVIGLGVRW
ncbi:MAG: hypothetical protein WAT39_10140 [Planctomycetota bacterium]